MRRRRTVSALIRGGCAATLGAVLVGCTAAREPTDSPVSTSEPTSSQAGTTTTAPPTTQPVSLPDNCGALLPVTDLDASLGTALPGSVSYVRGEPLPGIGRTDRITCGYGVAVGPDGRTQPPLLEISMASYTDEAAASDRVEDTTTDRQTAGDRVETTEVQTLPAVLLSGVAATTLVFAEANVTYSLTLLAAVLAPEQVPRGLVGVAEAVLEQAAAPTS
ncbi:MAG: hypothetical protein ACR2JK_19095 [Geodermatophilaceae bacterium]